MGNVDLDDEKFVLLAHLALDIGLCQVRNLRPLKGVIYDFERPQASPGAGFPSASDQFPADEDARRNQTTQADAPRPISADDAVREGVAISTSQQDVQNRRPAGIELEMSSRFLAAFRKAEIEAEEASCVGRAMIETTKEQARRLGIPFEEAVRILTGTKISQDVCEEVLRENECVDFPEPDPCNPTEPYRRIEGSCNNLQNPTWGRASTAFVRLHYPFYENGIDSMRGEGRNGSKILPSPRTVSFNLFSLNHNRPLANITLMLMQWGQFLDHDITFTAETQIKESVARSVIGSTLTRFFESNPEVEEQCPVVPEETVPLECCPNGNHANDANLHDCRPIDVSNDPVFTDDGKSCMRFVRSLIASQGCYLGPREQLNQLTAYIDGSAVYGSTDRVSQELREKEGGRLKKNEEDNLLPPNCCEDRTFQCFRAGDTRVNEQPGLASMHTLWLRFHERLAAEFSRINPHWDDETLYQECRRVLAALIQQVTYREWLPLVLGPQVMAEEDLVLLPVGPANTYDPNEDASIANVMATAAMRFGHTLVSDALQAAQGETVNLVGNFQNARALYEANTRPSAMLQGLASSSSQSPDPYLVLTLTNRLFASPENRTAFDLMSLNIQRGRDHGLPPYNTWRRACQLRTFSSFDELSTVMPPEVSQVFKNVYSDVDEIDLFPAGLAEFPVQEGLVGPTFACLLGNQFSRLKKGDRFFFQNMMQPKPFRTDQLQTISALSLAAIICQNTDIESLQPRVFETSGLNGNDLLPCSSYPILDLSLWKEDEVIPHSMTVCMGVGPFRGRAILDHWCTLNCNHNPSFCPPTHCKCDP